MQQRSEELYEQWKNGSTGTTLDTLTAYEQPDVVADFVAIVFQQQTWTRGSQVVTGLMSRYAKRFADGAKMRNELCDELFDLRQTAQDDRDSAMVADEVLDDLACSMCGRKPGEPRPITVDEGIACDRCRNWLTPHPVDPYHCPNCGSDELDDESQPEPLDEDYDGRVSTQRIGCTACGWHWTDVYTVKGYIEPEAPYDPPAVIKLKGFGTDPIDPATVEEMLAVQKKLNESSDTRCPQCDGSDLTVCYGDGTKVKCGNCGWRFSTVVTPTHTRTPAGA